MVFIFSSGLHGLKKKAKNKINVLQTNYSTEIWPYFSMGYNYKCHKNTFCGFDMNPAVRISKHISGQMSLSRPPWPVESAVLM